MELVMDPANQIPQEHTCYSCWQCYSREEDMEQHLQSNGGSCFCCKCVSKLNFGQVHHHSISFPDVQHPSSDEGGKSRADEFSLNQLDCTSNREKRSTPVDYLKERPMESTVRNEMIGVAEYSSQQTLTENEESVFCQENKATSSGALPYFSTSSGPAIAVSSRNDCYSCWRCFDSEEDMWQHLARNRGGCFCCKCVSNPNLGKARPMGCTLRNEVIGVAGYLSQQTLTEAKESIFCQENKAASSGTLPYFSTSSGPAIAASRRKDPHSVGKKESSLTRMSVPDRLPCPCCKNNFSSKRDLQVHLRRDVKRFVCCLCRKTLSVSNMAKHAKTHTGEKSHCCEVCGHSFSQKYKLKEHMRIHSGERPYTCRFCDRSFRLKCTLDTHVKIHTGEKPYSCQTCTKSFRLKSILDDHIRTHTGEKPHSCRICGKSFIKKFLLNRHVMMHTRENTHSSQSCDKSFARKVALLQDAKIHTRHDFHDCDKSGDRYPSTNSSLKKLSQHRYAESSTSGITEEEKENDSGYNRVNIVSSALSNKETEGSTYSMTKDANVFQDSEAVNGTVTPDSSSNHIVFGNSFGNGSDSLYRDQTELLSNSGLSDSKSNGFSCPNAMYLFV